MTTKIYNGDCQEEMKRFTPNSIDAIVTDPPYELNFMGKGWDNAGVSFNKKTWEKCLRVLKPGGYLLAFGGTRTYHRIACAIEDAGFEIRDCIMWLYGSGFPKSLNIGLAVDKKLGNESKVTGVRKQSGAKFKLTQELIDNGGFNDPDRKEFEVKEAQNKWKGWGTALKPSYEPIIVARKPFNGSLVDNVIEYGVGGLNIDECRVETSDTYSYPNGGGGSSFGIGKGVDGTRTVPTESNPLGRFPANTILTYDETDFDEVCGGFPNTKGGKYKEPSARKRNNGLGLGTNCERIGKSNAPDNYGDSGSASRYFYCAKASKKDRDEGLEERNIHPTVKPTSLMQYLIRLVAPKGATILDPFMGSGSTGKAVMYENKERDADYSFIGIEMNPEYCKIAEARIKHSR